MAFAKVAVIVLLSSSILAQSNYDDQANSIEYSGEGLPESTILDGKVTNLNTLSDKIFLNRTTAYLNCAAGYMQIELNFMENFTGMVYAEFDRSSACRIFGKGTNRAKIDLPLKGCGTRQDPQRVFTNNIVVRFHPPLEMDGDEVVTIVCRYPPPIAPPPKPPVIPPPIPPGPLLQEAPLQSLHILLIVCGILFLSLVLLGMAASYYCVRNQKVRVIRRHPVTTAGSEITKMSESDISMFEGIRIPRAHALVTTTASYSESETAMISAMETLPSDYPSESPSTVHSEDGVSSGGSYDNKAYAQETSTYYSEQYGRSETELLESVARRPVPPPDFSVRMKFKAPLPPPTPSTTDTESVVDALSTIHEREEMEMEQRTTFEYQPEIHAPPLYTEVLRKSPREKTDTWRSEKHMDMTEWAESEVATPMAEPPVVVTHRPEVTSHFVDDVFLKTITEKKTIEDIERHRRQVTEYQAKPIPPPPKWDVTINNYPDPNAVPVRNSDTGTDWDTVSENSSIYGVAPVRKSHLESSQFTYKRMEEKTYASSADIPVPDPPPRNWDILTRILEEPETEVFKSEYHLNVEDRKKWRKIITTESTLRTLLTEATVREDYERIRKDSRYERLFEPEKWDVIIRILAPPPQDRLYEKSGAGSSRYRKKSDWDNRSRRSSLPTLYEYDSDGSKHPKPEVRSRKTSRSSMRSDMDVRSMSEMTVDMRPDLRDNGSEVSSYYRPRFYDDEEDEDDRSIARSLSQPSLARSASEFTEHWGIRRGWDSPDHSPRSSVRSARNTNVQTTYSMQQQQQQQSSSYQRKHWFHDESEK